MSCPCTQPTAVVPPLVKLIRAGTTPTSSCAMGQPYETLSITTFVPQAVAATQTVAVCSAASYLIGTCVLLVDSSGNTQVQRVTGHVGTDTLTLTAYTNDYSDTTTTLTGVIYMQPVGICPPDTTSDTECFRTYAETLDAFVMPAEDGTVEVTFTEAVSFPYGAEVFIEGAGWMMVDNPPTGGFVACSESHYMTNIGTDGNEDPGETITGGAYVFIGQAPAEPTTAGGSAILSEDLGIGTMNSHDGVNPSPSASTSGLVVPWAAHVHVTAWMERDNSAGGFSDNSTLPAGYEDSPNGHYQIRLQKSSDGGANWSNIELMEISHFGAPSTTVTHVAAFAAGTYLFRIVTDEAHATTAFSGAARWPVFFSAKIRAFAVKVV